MTSTEQDNELREKVADALRTGYHGIAETKVINHVMQLITADRKRVALESRVNEIVGILSRNVTSGESVKTNISIPRVLTLNERYVELKAQQEEK